MKVFYTTDRATITPPKAGDAGYDLHAAEVMLIYPRCRALVSTGARIELPQGTVGIIADRSSVALNAGLHVMGGVIDSQFRGTVGVILLNTTDAPYKVGAGQRIAQLLVLPMLTPALEEVTDEGELSATARGNGGFGSTGK